MYNIRKKPVKNWLEIDHVLRIEKPEREVLFKEAMEKVGDKQVVTDFWNMLVEYKNHDKSFGVVSSQKLPDGNTNWVVTLLSIAAAGGTMYGILKLNGYQDAANWTSILANAGIIGANGKAIFNDFHHQPKAQKIQNALEAMRILYPDLYDIELCYNKVDMDLIKKGDLRGKKAYQEANRIWNEAKKQGKENDIATRFKMKNAMEKIYNQEKPQPQIEEDEDWLFK